MANTMPPRGVLKAAAIPAAPPATSNSRSLMPEAGDSQRRACSITPAATCTDGPCRPTDKPASKPPDTPSTLATLSFRDTKRERSLSGVSGASAVSTCGTPEPTAPGAQRRMVQTIKAVRAGVQIKGAHHQPLRMRL